MRYQVGGYYVSMYTMYLMDINDGCVVTKGNNNLTENVSKNQMFYIGHLENLGRFRG